MLINALRKRIALVAVASLGAALLVVSPANATPTYGGLGIAGNGGDSDSSRGLVTSDTGYGFIINNKLGSIKMLGTGSLFVGAWETNTSYDLETANSIIVSGATITSCQVSLGEVTLNSTGTSCLSAANEYLTAIVKPNAGVTSFTISQYNDSVTSVLNRITVSVVAASTVNVFSADKSCFITYSDAWEESYPGEDCSDAVTRYITGPLSHNGDYAKGAPTTTVLNGEYGTAYVALNDSNGNPLSPTTTAVTATVTGGCNVGFYGPENAVGTAASAISNEGVIYITKISPTAPAKCVVTGSVNGAVVKTKTFTFLGEVTKLAISKIGISPINSPQYSFLVDAQDSAGNSIPGVAISNGGSLTGVVSEILTDGYTDYDFGGTIAGVVCTDKGLAKDLKVKATNDSATTIYSDAFSIQCSGDPVNYTASLDKAVYSIGEVATLTITAKDSKGNLTWDGALLADNTDTNSAAKTAVSIAGGPLVQVGSIVSSDSFTTGVKKYKFTVGGISTGSYNLVVDLPYLNSTLYSQAAVPVAYKVVTTADNGVQMNDVLKAIVSLIASINKQIAALQKALLKKK